MPCQGETDMQKHNIREISKLLSFLFVCFVFNGTSHAASTTEIDIKTSASLENFKEEVLGAEKFLEKAEGVLVFPDVVKAGFGIGGEYGEGSLLIKGKTVDYYSTAAVSIGFQFGAQFKTVMLIFLQKDALDNFRNSDGWEAGVDGSVALVKLGAGKDINTVNFAEPIVGFVFSNKGLMYNLTLEGSKMTKMDK
ncbi:MAG: lipid-binding SYLF domain-containing protein [Planctomycetota bacterium]|jgi:lipid-binding SYLF domain-containing protein